MGNISPTGMQRRSDVLFTSHIVRDTADHIETSSRRRNWHFNETDPFDTLLQRFIGTLIK